VVDRVHEVVVLVPDVRRIAVEHGVRAVVLREDLGPVEVLEDHVVEPVGEFVEAVDLVRVRLSLTPNLRGPEPGSRVVRPSPLRVPEVEELAGTLDRVGGLSRNLLVILTSLFLTVHYLDTLLFASSIRNRRWSEHHISRESLLGVRWD